jgi:hypothetical protein
MVPPDENLPRSGRREFLSRFSAAVASGLLWHETAEAADSPPARLPTITLGPYRLSRLIVGSNPISGYSYLGREMDREMKAYFTPERTLRFLQRCEREGINTHQFSPASKATDIYRALRRQGSKLQLIGLHSKREDLQRLVEAVQPIAIAHHGGVTDRLFREGHSGQVRDFVKAVHDQGLLAGVSAHNPDCIRRIADEGWEVDFFMTCFYFLTREKSDGAAAETPPLLDGPDVGYPFYKTDPQAMCRVIRAVKQPCLAFKILGAGRRCASQAMVREAFEFAFRNIKPGDAVIVGMYPRHFDQVHANAEYTRPREVSA